MSSITIPQVTQIKCDGCLKIVGEGAVRKQRGHLDLQRDLLDMHGAPAANGNMQFDFCDACLAEVCTALNDTVAAIRNGGTSA